MGYKVGGGIDFIAILCMFSGFDVIGWGFKGCEFFVFEKYLVVFGFNILLCLFFNV